MLQLRNNRRWANSRGVQQHTTSSLQKPHRIRVKSVKKIDLRLTSLLQPRPPKHNLSPNMQLMHACSVHVLNQTLSSIDMERQTKGNCLPTRRIDHYYSLQYICWLLAQNCMRASTHASTCHTFYSQIDNILTRNQLVYGGWLQVHLGIVFGFS